MINKDELIYKLEAVIEYLKNTGCKSQYKNVGKVENKNVGLM